jgi:undecaprenyl diphosphate synthase
MTAPNTNESPNGPKSIGIIMDGNRRWAKEKNLPSIEGHRAGLEKIKEVMKWAQDAGIREVTIYTFSTENWNRSREEVGYFMELFEFAFHTWLEEVIKEGIRVRFIGERVRVSEKILKLMEKTEQESNQGEKGTLVVAFSYGGRLEILEAVNKLITEGKGSVTEEEFSAAMWNAGLRDPDLIIRTGGEKRLSGFLTWQSVYSELFFVDEMWPAFTKEHFDAVLAEYSSRERRHGK